MYLFNAIVKYYNSKIFHVGFMVNTEVTVPSEFLLAIWRHGLERSNGFGSFWSDSYCLIGFHLLND